MINSMRNFNLKTILFLFIFLGSFLFQKNIISVLAQSATSEKEEKVCNDIQELENQCAKLSRKSCQNLLERCRDYFEKQAENYKKSIKEKEIEEKTFQNQISIYNNKINQLNSLIQKNKLIIKDLNFQIEDTSKSIIQTENEIEKAKKQLTQILQSMYEQNQKPLLTILLAGESFASFFDNLTALDILNSKTQEVLEKITNLHQELAAKKQELAQEKENLERKMMMTELQKKESEAVKKQKEILLSKTKGEKKLYENYLKEAQEKAAQIRKRIFELAQISESQAPTLEEAYQLAVEVEKISGVRPALLLGLLTVESAIGKNVGQCNCEGSPNCSHPEISWQKVMRQNQWDAFLKITKELGLNANKTPVSCAINGGKIQWGGAMGPAQFLPTTWLLYKEKIENFVKEKPANPWRIRDAFLAAALYLKDWGADSQKENDEIGAVTAYLCGTSLMTNTCRAAGGVSYRYQVMQKANEYQSYVDQGILTAK
jgi:membrane-bound lytic murein transglycosylase B